MTEPRVHHAEVNQEIVWKVIGQKASHAQTQQPHIPWQLVRIRRDEC